MVHVEERNLEYYVKNDVSVFLNMKEFARYHDVDGHKLRCVLTSDSAAVPVVAPEGEILSGRNMVMYVSHEDITGISAGQSVRIDGKIYLVKDAQDVQNILWRIKLAGDVN